MKKYRFRIRIYLIIFIFMVVCLSFSNIFQRDKIICYSWVLAMVVNIVVAIDCLFTCISVNDDSVTLKKLYKSTIMYWNDIDIITQDSSNNIILLGKREIKILTLIKDQDVLLKLIVNKVYDNGKTKVDLRILERIKK